MVFVLSSLELIKYVQTIASYIVSSSFGLIILAPMVFLNFLSIHVCIDFGGVFVNPMSVIPWCDNTLKTMYFSFPCFGSQSEKLEELCALIGKYFLNAECKIVLVNKFTVSTFLNYKDKLPAGVRASLVYKFSCAQCASTYIGSTGRMLRTRVAEHMLGGVIEQGLGWLTLRIRPSASMRKDVMSVWCWMDNFSILNCTSSFGPSHFRIFVYF